MRRTQLNTTRPRFGPVYNTLHKDLGHTWAKVHSYRSSSRHCRRLDFRESLNPGGNEDALRMRKKITQNVPLGYARFSKS